MSKTILSDDELQYIEHANKILQEHLELVQLVVNSSEGLLNNYVPILKTYVDNTAGIQNDFGMIVSNIGKSSRELSIITGNTQKIIDFINTVIRLNDILTPELIEKLNKIVK